MVESETTPASGPLTYIIGMYAFLYAYMHRKYVF